MKRFCKRCGNKIAELPSFLGKGDPYYFEPTKEQADELISILDSGTVTAIEALLILDALYNTEYMPTESSEGRHEDFLQDIGYSLTEEDVGKMDVEDIGSLFHNIFYNTRDLTDFVINVMPTLVNKFVMGLVHEDARDILRDLTWSPKPLEKYFDELKGYLGMMIEEEV